MTAAILTRPYRKNTSSAPSSKDSTKRCDLCEGDRFELISRHDRKRLELHTEVCTQCGLVSHRRIPSEAELAAFYARDYRRQYHGEITPSARRVLRAWRTGQRIYRRIAPWIQPGSAVCEIGAGIGCTVKVFEQRGHRSTGVEPNDGFQSFSRERLRAAVAQGFLHDLPMRPAYDAALLVHVIEHFRSPRAALEHLHCLLHPRGVLYVECPNLGEHAPRNGQFHFAHIHNFTPATLSMMANRAGFKVLHWFSQPRDPILKILLRRVEQPQWRIDPGSYRQTMSALERYNVWTYHLRPRYLAGRVAQLANQGWEWLAASVCVPRIMAACDPAEKLMPTGNLLPPTRTKLVHD